MARITPQQQEVMIVVDKWIVDAKPVFSHWDYNQEQAIVSDVNIQSPKYWVLIDSLAALLRNKREQEAKVFGKAVEAAYQKGIRVGKRLKG